MTARVFLESRAWIWGRTRGMQQAGYLQLKHRRMNEPVVVIVRNGTSVMAEVTEVN
jgi:hypothetical protein